MKIEHVPIARTEMLIRRPVAEVFRAFVAPEVTSRAARRLRLRREVRLDERPLRGVVAGQHALAVANGVPGTTAARQLKGEIHG